MRTEKTRGWAAPIRRDYRVTDSFPELSGLHSDTSTTPDRYAIGAGDELLHSPDGSRPSRRLHGREHRRLDGSSEISVGAPTSPVDATFTVDHELFGDTLSADIEGEICRYDPWKGREPLSADTTISV